MSVAAAAADASETLAAQRMLSEGADLLANTDALAQANWSPFTSASDLDDANFGATTSTTDQHEYDQYIFPSLVDDYLNALGNDAQPIRFQSYSCHTFLQLVRARHLKW